MAFKARKTFVFAGTGSALTALDMGCGGTGQVEVSSSVGDSYVIFGVSTTLSSSTVTAQALPDGVFKVLAGQSKLYSLEGQTHVSVLAAVGVTTDVTVGHGEQI